MTRVRAITTFHDGGTGLMTPGQMADVDKKLADDLLAGGLVEIISPDDGEPVPERKSKGVTLTDKTELKQGEPLLKKQSDMEEKPKQTDAPKQAKPHSEPLPREAASATSEDKTEKEPEKAEKSKPARAETPKKKYK